ncbi:MAG: DNA repair protein RecN [Clostridiales bacterium]|jgi:DNA repair protein RecN (Recombination protein N)|nr:DNA repair protein RecN [Clostridiales bacterium]
MIERLYIKNVALIEEAEAEFRAGLNILSGETGAGKSVLIDSIHFLLGERPGKDFLRGGADSALVEGCVRVTEEKNREAIRGMGIEIAEDDLLFVARTLNEQGRSVCRVNGRSLSIGMLREISTLLLDVHGQHEHQSLLNPSKHIELLDQFCGGSFEKDKQTLAETLKEYREILKNIKAIGGNEEDRLEILRYQIEEIDSARLTEDEEDVLNQRRNVLRAAEKLSRNTREALRWLQGGEHDEGAVDAAGHALLLLTEIGAMDSDWARMAEQLTRAQESLEGIVGELLRYAERLEEDPAGLEEIEVRLDLIYRLKKKYGGGVPDVIRHYNRLKAEWERLLNSEEKIAALNRAKKDLAARMIGLCSRISGQRKTLAAEIEREIEAALRELGMKNVRFAISVERKNAFSASGCDKVEFLISPNLGEPLKPLAKIASGGEMSRVMLALKTVMADADTIETFIFDEIDAGVSGRTAQQVAEKLAFLAQKRQILCITHLPQIAAMADSHYLIEKQSDGSRTAAKVYELDRAQMISELARLIGGAQITEATWKAAAEMKELAKPISLVSCKA